MPVLWSGRVFGHYRLEFLRCLTTDYRIQIDAAADWNESVVFNGDIDVINQAARNANIIHLRNHYFGPLLWQTGLLKLVASRKYAIVLAVGDPHHLSTWVALVIGRFTRTKIVLWTHGWKPSQGLGKRLVLRIFYSLSRHLLLYSKEAESIGAEQGFPRQRMTVVSNSSSSKSDVSPHRTNGLLRQEIMRAIGLELDWPVVICTTRLLPERRLDLLLDAAQKLGNSGLPINVLLVGDGPAMDALRIQASKFPGNVVFIGSLFDRTRIQEMHSISDLTVIPSRAGLGIVTSMTYGVPVIIDSNFALHGPESSAVLPGVTGDLFAQSDAESLARVMRAWLKDRPKLDRARSECTSLILQSYSAEKQATLVAQALGRVVGTSHQRRSGLDPRRET